MKNEILAFMRDLRADGETWRDVEEAVLVEFVDARGLDEDQVFDAISEAELAILDEEGRRCDRCDGTGLRQSGRDAAGCEVYVRCECQADDPPAIVPDGVSHVSTIPADPREDRL